MRIDKNGRIRFGSAENPNNSYDQKIFAPLIIVSIIGFILIIVGELFVGRASDLSYFGFYASLLSFCLAYIYAFVTDKDFVFSFEEILRLFFGNIFIIGVAKFFFWVFVEQ